MNNFSSLKDLLRFLGSSVVMIIYLIFVCDCFMKSTHIFQKAQWWCQPEGKPHVKSTEGSFQTLSNVPQFVSFVPKFEMDSVHFPSINLQAIPLYGKVKKGFSVCFHSNKKAVISCKLFYRVQWNIVHSFMIPPGWVGITLISWAPISGLWMEICLQMKHVNYTC